jgi:hypothetical protein
MSHEVTSKLCSQLEPSDIRWLIVTIRLFQFSRWHNVRNAKIGQNARQGCPPTTTATSTHAPTVFVPCQRISPAIDKVSDESIVSKSGS